MSTTPKIEVVHDGNTVTLECRTITGAMLDTIEPIRARQREISMERELLELAASNEAVFSLIDPSTRGLREGVTQEQLQAFVRENISFMKAIYAPTVRLSTDPRGRALMVEIVQKTIGREGVDATLLKQIDSKADSKWWKNFDVEQLIGYVESFCERARI